MTRRYAISNDKIKAELGFEPGYSFESGIDATIEWYLKIPNGWITLKKRCQTQG